MTTTRLNKYIASTGYCSRRKADELIENSKIIVNGRAVINMGTKVDPEEDEIRIKNGPILQQIKTTTLIALYKPKGYICSKADPHNSRTVYQLLPKQLQHLFTIGRLDKDTEGLILLTNNGELANIYTHPRHQKLKTYIVECRGKLTEKAISRMEKGMHLREYKTNPAHAKVLRFNNVKNRSTVEVHLKEGKKPQIRNMFLAVGNPVKHLLRTGFGPYTLGHLSIGEWKEVKAYLNHH
jgi:23S rRNA pseudouridine2605 synthase